MARRTYAQETTGLIMETNTEMIQVFVLFFFLCGCRLSGGQKSNSVRTPGFLCPALALPDEEAAAVCWDF